MDRSVERAVAVERGQFGGICRGPDVSNVTARQIPDTRQVEITYDSADAAGATRRARGSWLPSTRSMASSCACSSMRECGPHYRASWNGRDGRGRRMASGVYIAVVSAGGSAWRGRPSCCSRRRGCLSTPRGTKARWRPSRCSQWRCTCSSTPYADPEDMSTSR